VFRAIRYTDQHLEHFLLGDTRCIDDTIVVKAHPVHCGVPCMEDIASRPVP
jgi:hypothetical protein